jgi:hypothetical protein
MFDSRATLRFPVDLPARLLVGETELTARVRNLSLGGVFIAGPALPIGTRCRLRFRAPHLDAFDQWCVAKWTTAEGCGLEFEAMQPLDTYQLARFIRQASRVTSRLPTDAILRPPAR